MSVDVSALLQRADQLQARIAQVQPDAGPEFIKTASQLMLRFYFHVRRQPTMPEPPTERALGMFGVWFAEFEGLLTEGEALLDTVDAKRGNRG